MRLAPSFFVVGSIESAVTQGFTEGCKKTSLVLGIIGGGNSESETENFSLLAPLGDVELPFVIPYVRFGIDKFHVGFFEVEQASDSGKFARIPRCRDNEDNGGNGDGCAGSDNGCVKEVETISTHDTRNPTDDPPTDDPPFERGSGEGV